MLEARKLKVIGKEIYSLGYIDSPMEVAKKFSLADAKAVNKAVADKLAQWDSLSLEQQLKKLNFEAYDFLGGNYHNVQQKYPTWQVSQQAYVKQIGIVQDKIDWKAIKDSYADLSKFSTKSKPYQSLIAQLENAINGNDKAMAQQTITELNARKALKKPLPSVNQKSRMLSLRIPILRRKERMRRNGLFIVRMQTIISLIMPWICGNLQAPMKRRLCINIRLVVVT